MCKYADTQYYYIHRPTHHALSVDINGTLFPLPLLSRKWEDAAKHWRSSVHVFPANATSHYLQGKYFQASKRGALWKNTCARHIAIVCVFMLFLWDAVSCLIFGALLVVCHSENFAALNLRSWASTTKQWSAMLSRSTGKGALKKTDGYIFWVIKGTIP